MKFSPNDRVGFSDLGRERNPRLAEKCGTILNASGSANIYLVLLDGNRSPTRLHETYLKLLEPGR